MGRQVQGSDLRGGMLQLMQTELHPVGMDAPILQGQADGLLDSIGRVIPMQL